MHDTDAMVWTTDLIVLRQLNNDWIYNIIDLLNSENTIFIKNYAAPKPVIHRVEHAFDYDN
jgi:hypothetical protein